MSVKTQKEKRTITIIIYFQYEKASNLYKKHIVSRAHINNGAERERELIIYHRLKKKSI